MNKEKFKWEIKENNKFRKFILIRNSFLFIIIGVIIYGFTLFIDLSNKTCVIENKYTTQTYYGSPRFFMTLRELETGDIFTSEVKSRIYTIYSKNDTIKTDDLSYFVFEHF